MASAERLTVLFVLFFNLWISGKAELTTYYLNLVALIELISLHNRHIFIATQSSSVTSEPIELKIAATTAEKS